MGLLKLAGFTGMWPVRDARALPDNAAVDATNIRVDGGAYLKPARAPTVIKALSGTTVSTYRIPLPGANTLANSYWMEFTDANTDVVRAPIVNDTFERIYWASPTTGLRYAPKASIIAGTTGFEAGVPAPTAACTVDAVAGTGNIDPLTLENTEPIVTRSYVYTFINVYGEESQPSPAAEETGAIDQHWLITNIQQPGSPGARAAYQTIRLYRTVTAASGATTFYKVVDLAVGTTFYSDYLSDLFVTGQTQMEATYWSPPPSGLQGLAALPNGIFVSWKDNQLYFSENYKPHSWPAEYMITVDYPIVGLGVFGNSCVVCTTGAPFIVSGTSSASLTLTKTDAPLPCLNRRSITPAAEGVYYASDEGLVLVGPSGISIVTRELFSREQWQRDYVPSQLRSTFVAGQYIALMYGTSTDGFMFEPQNAAARGVSKMDVIYAPINIGTEPYTGKPWLIGSYLGGVYLLEMQEPSASSLTYTWRSKEIQYPHPTNFVVGQAYYDDTAGVPLHMSVWATLRGNDGTLTKTLVYNTTVGPSGREFRLPSGFKSDIWQIELVGSTTVQSVMLATSVRELRGG